MIFYGPPGTGKTTVAQIISKNANKEFHKINATTASISDIKDVLSKVNPILHPNGMLLYIDEIQYFNKKQQQSLLEFIESGDITLIASTTENPYFYIHNALLSRCNVFEFKKVSKDEILKSLNRAIEIVEKEQNIKIEIDDKSLSLIAEASQGDVRKSSNILELCLKISDTIDNIKIISYEKISNLLNNMPLSSYNSTGDDHFDLLSAFQKSMRGSDPHASIYYLARLLDVGEIASVCRRLMVCACEDVGLAYPQLIPIVKSAVDMANQLGMPEARIPLADAVIMVSLAPKSNSAYNAINNAMQDVKNGHVYQIPRHLQNVHCDSCVQGNNNSNIYKYPHNFENHWVSQQYLPDEIKNKKYYFPQKNKNESAFQEYIKKLTQGDRSN